MTKTGDISMALDVSQLSAGIYIVKVFIDNEIFGKQKFIKE